MGFALETPVDAVLRRCFHGASANVVLVLHSHFETTSYESVFPGLKCRSVTTFRAAFAR